MDNLDNNIGVGGSCFNTLLEYERILDDERPSCFAECVAEDGPSTPTCIVLLWRRKMSWGLLNEIHSMLHWTCWRRRRRRIPRVTTKRRGERSREGQKTCVLIISTRMEISSVCSQGRQSGTRFIARMKIVDFPSTQNCSASLGTASGCLMMNIAISFEKSVTASCLSDGWVVMVQAFLPLQSAYCSWGPCVTLVAV